MSVDSFQELLKPVTDFVSSQAVDSALAEKLNSQFPHSSKTFKAIEAACHEAISDGCVSGMRNRNTVTAAAPIPATA